MRGIPSTDGRLRQLRRCTDGRLRLLRLRIPLLAVLALLLSACGGESTGGGNDARGLAGTWQGEIDVPGSPLPIQVTFTGEGPDVTGTIDIPVQGIAGRPLRDITRTGDEVRFAIADVPGDPVFAGTVAGAEISGQLTQFGRSLPFRLTRGELAPPARPQEPKPPYPYRTEDVTFDGAGVRLAGTVTSPADGGPHPGVVLITGSGPQDRDETIAAHKPFLLLADTLTRAGFVVLRTDDRGVGGSGGNLDSATYAELADDARAGVAFLAARPDVDPHRIGLLGHSEGGYLAPLAAERAQSGEIAFAVLMAGPAVRGADVLLEQNRLLLEAGGASEEQVRAQLDYVRRLTGLVVSGDIAGAQQLTRERTLQQGLTAEQADAAAATIPSLREFLAYDPAPALHALRIPVFAFFGSKDLQVPAAQNEGPMRAALAGSPDAEVRTFDGLNHLMQPATTGLPDEYARLETTIDPQVLDAVTTWLKAR